MVMTCRGYCIPIAEKDLKFINTIKAQLTVTPKQTYRTRPIKFRIYDIVKDRFLIVPRSWGLKRLGEPEIKVSDGVPINVEFTGSLCQRRRQDEQVQCIMEEFRKPYAGGILSVPCGYGKTTAALYICAQLKLKTAVVVHKVFLMDQWKERIQSLLPMARIGCIQGKQFDVEADIVICMLQTMSKRTYDFQEMSKFGFVIFDECHLLSTPCFSKCFRNLNCRYVLGLSATPSRADGLWNVVEWNIGDVLFQCDRPIANTVLVKRIETGIFVEETFTKFGKLNYSSMISDLSETHKRNDIILNCIGEAHQEGYCILVLVDRREHVTTLADALKDVHNIEAGIYLGGMKQDTLNGSAEMDVIVATFPMAATGLDIPKLNCLILASPHSNVIQACGRVMRGDASCCILDLVDRNIIFKNQWHARRKTYSAGGYTILHVDKGCDRRQAHAQLQSVFNFVDNDQE